MLIHTEKQSMSTNRKERSERKPERGAKTEGTLPHASSREYRARLDLKKPTLLGFSLIYVSLKRQVLG